MRKIAVFFACCLAMTIGSLAATYPQLALGHGYECVVFLTNKSEDEWRGSLKLRQGASEPWNSPVHINGTNVTGLDSVPIVLAPHATIKLVIEGDSTLRAGYLSIDADSPFDRLNLAAVFFYNYLTALRLELQDAGFQLTSVPPQ